ncbi:unnamed protein product [Acanthosepion pharaonis]|uniref:Uncharacterized protein n=1 Tax=Acanthosepion pharaonis TaxID=158019 RepID=A0A812CPB6_ACAPH|nr:unnamed protein product [Sepia pharaonis]
MFSVMPEQWSVSFRGRLNGSIFCGEKNCFHQSTKRLLHFFLSRPHSLYRLNSSVISLCLLSNQPNVYYTSFCLDHIPLYRLNSSVISLGLLSNQPNVYYTSFCLDHIPLYRLNSSVISLGLLSNQPNVYYTSFCLDHIPLYRLNSSVISLCLLSNQPNVYYTFLSRPHSFISFKLFCDISWSVI